MKNILEGDALELGMLGFRTLILFAKQDEMYVPLATSLAAHFSEQVVAKLAPDREIQSNLSLVVKDMPWQAIMT